MFLRNRTFLDVLLMVVHLFRLRPLTEVPVCCGFVARAFILAAVSDLLLFHRTLALLQTHFFWMQCSAVRTWTKRDSSSRRKAQAQINLSFANQVRKHVDFCITDGRITALEDHQICRENFQMPAPENTDRES
jgi:hypothetical protein